MSSFAEVLKTLGAIAGVVALVWRVVDEFGSYLRISLRVEPQRDKWVTILTSVENRGNRAKDISYALLLVGPESESPLATASHLARSIGYSGPMRFTNDLEHLRVDGPFFMDGRGLVPLPFFYSENVDIADETLSYRAPISVYNLLPDQAYSVRLFVFGRGRLHRSTQECFITAA